MADARTALERLQSERAAVEATPDRPEIVAHRPTPLSQAVDGPEVHFQIREGRIAYIPIEPLLLLAREHIRSKLHDFATRPDLSESANVVGPQEGFRFRYAIERFEELERTPQGMARREGVRMVRWTVIPTSSNLGEPVDAALAEGSAFRRVLAEHAPPETTITLWVYEDSFGSYRKIRDALHALNRTCAARPLPESAMISGSVNGTKSAAE